MDQLIIPGQMCSSLTEVFFKMRGGFRVGHERHVHMRPLSIQRDTKRPGGKFDLAALTIAAAASKQLLRSFCETFTDFRCIRRPSELASAGRIQLARNI